MIEGKETKGGKLVILRTQRAVFSLQYAGQKGKRGGGGKGRRLRKKKKTGQRDAFLSKTENMPQLRKKKKCGTDRRGVCGKWGSVFLNLKQRKKGWVMGTRLDTPGEKKASMLRGAQ